MRRRSQAGASRANPYARHPRTPPASRHPARRPHGALSGPGAPCPTPPARPSRGRRAGAAPPGSPRHRAARGCAKAPRAPIRPPSSAPASRRGRARIRRPPAPFRSRSRRTALRAAVPQFLDTADCRRRPPGGSAPRPRSRASSRQAATCHSKPDRLTEINCRCAQSPRSNASSENGSGGRGPPVLPGRIRQGKRLQPEQRRHARIGASIRAQSRRTCAVSASTGSP